MIKMISPAERTPSPPEDRNEGTTHARVLWSLQERIKELTALHRVAHILQTDRGSVSGVLQQIVDLLPPAWQYPEIATARLSYGSLRVSTGASDVVKGAQTAIFKTSSGREGFLEVTYSEEKPEIDEGPFLREERSLINSVAQMVQAYLDRRIYRLALKRSNQTLERQVQIRTRQLEKINFSLKTEIQERRQAERKIRSYKKDLQKLVSELARTEELQRRAIAEDLHDHLGQALAMLKMKLLDLHGEAMFYGMEGRIDELSLLLKKIIQFTRTLTAEIFPPVLHELGLGAAMEWLAERFQEKYGLRVHWRQTGTPDRLSDDLEGAVFKAARELLTNVVKHAQAKSAAVSLEWFPTELHLRVSDEGKGFDHPAMKKRLIRECGFGLFSLKERIRFFGGKLTIEARPGKGTHVNIALPITGRRENHG